MTTNQSAKDKPNVELGLIRGVQMQKDLEKSLGCEPDKGQMFCFTIEQLNQLKKFNFKSGQCQARQEMLDEFILLCEDDVTLFGEEIHKLQKKYGLKELKQSTDKTVGDEE